MTIWKYPLEVTGEQRILVPKDARLLSVQIQYEIPHLWALVNTRMLKEERVILTFGTGDPIEKREIRNSLVNYLGTYQMQNGKLVYHVMERMQYD